MIDGEYCYLLTVEVGDELKLARMDVGEAERGYLVMLSDGSLGVVDRVAFVDAQSAEYGMFEDLMPMLSVKEVWRRTWREERSYADP